MPLSSMTIGQNSLRRLIEETAVDLSSREWSIAEVASLSSAISLKRIADYFAEEDRRRKEQLLGNPLTVSEEYLTDNLQSKPRRKR